MTFNGPIGGLIDFAIGGGWGSEVPKENHSRVAVIRGTDIPKVASGEFSTVPFRYEADKKILNRILAPGDVVLETAGGSSANGQYTGRTLLITQEILDVLGPTICASFCKKLVLNKNLVSPSYFYFYMQDLYKSGRVAAYDSQSTGISNFQYEAFVDNELLELPKLEIQTSVASALVNLQSKINNNSQISKTLEAIAQTIFKSWFIDFDPVKAKMVGEKPAGMDDATAALFPDSMEESELGLIPKGWEISNVEIFCPFKYGKALPSNKRVAGDISVYGSNGVVGRHNVALTSENSIVIGRKGTVGKVFLEPAPCWVIDTAFYANTSEPKDIYLAYSLVRNLGLEEMNSDGAVPGLNRENAHRLMFTIGTAKLRNIFAEYSHKIFLQIDNLHAQTSSLIAMRDSLLPRLISGELQIPDEMFVS
jgi:type I restriction enzyme S subunit